MNLRIKRTAQLFLFTFFISNIAIVRGQTTNMEPVNSTQHHNVKGGYKNTAADFTNNTELLPLLWRYITEEKKDALPSKPIPVRPLTQKQLEQLPSHTDSIIRFGHSTIYANLSGQRWLIDPVFSDRASPFSFLGPKRFHQPPISLNQLPKLHGVIISHDHYDHLDKASVKQLESLVDVFIVPLGVDKHLTDWGIAANKIQALDWWQSYTVNDVTITATPTQHFSGRGLFDRNETLWASYAIQSKNSNIYFSGDSGYFEGFKEIGERLGPFDLTMVETGAYDKDWATIHMTPPESIQAHIDLQGKAVMPIHNGTFDLAFHSWYDPFVQSHQLATEKNIPIVTPVMGEVIFVNHMASSQQWWLD